MKQKEASQLAKQPTVELVLSVKKEFEENERYSNEDKIQKIITEKVFDKERYETYLMTVILINELYSTNIYRTDIIANHIFKNRDEIYFLIKNGDSKAVERIAKGHGVGVKTEENKKELNFYSFASKYCNYFNSEEFPIYDSYIDNMLWIYKNNDSFHIFKREDMKNYESFRSIVREFRIYYNLQKFSLRDIDKFLWLYGKTIYSSKYNGRENK